jgi:FlaA1/EpsC-like NDP-sugar epimerase
MEVGKVVVFSRDETKQSQMCTEYQDSRLNFILGDIRDEQSIQAALQDINFVFHGPTKCERTLLGFMPGEKIHETLLNAKERAIAINHDRFFQVPILKETAGLGLSPKQSTSEFSSNNTRMLSSDELANLLSGIPIIKSLL